MEACHRHERATRSLADTARHDEQDGWTWQEQNEHGSDAEGNEYLGGRHGTKVLGAHVAPKMISQPSESLLAYLSM